MANTTFAPFSPAQSSANYISGATQLPVNFNSAGRVPVSANQLTPGSNMNLSAGHQQLAQNLQNSMNQNSLPSLMQTMLANPQLAAQVGGFANKNEYTPNQPSNAWRLTFDQPGNHDWNGGTGYGEGGQSIGQANLWNGIPTSMSGQPMDTSKGIPQVPSIYANNPQYQQWLSNQPKQPTQWANPMGLGATPQAIDPNNPYQQWLANVSSPIN